MTNGVLQEPPRAVRAKAALLADFQAQVTASGMPTVWPAAKA
jgi:hypothetical protein